MAGLSYFKAQYFGAKYLTLPLLDYNSGGSSSGVTDWWLIAARRRGRR